MTFLRRIRRTGEDSTGSTVVEMALIVPAMVMLLLVVVEFGIMFTAQGLLDTAALRASRTGSTGFSPNGSTREAYIRNFIADQAFGLLKADKIGIAATAYSSFDDIGKQGKGTSGFGTSGQVVEYKLSYPWKGITPLVSWLVTSRTVNLSASLAVRNEAW